MDEKTIARFWSKVDRRGPDECWEWRAYRMPNGYGQMGIGRKVFSAHRLAYCIGASVDLPAIADWCVMHSCDNRGCVNPSHLSLGTYRDNNSDMDAKGRRGVVRGEIAGRAKLTEHDVKAIRAARAAGAKVVPLAKTYGVYYTTIIAIAKRKSWKHIP
jgi:hypothetical protein